MLYSPFLRAVAEYIRPEVKSRPYKFNIIYLHEKRLSLSLTDNLEVVGWYTVPAKTPNNGKEMTAFKIDLTLPDSLDLIKSHVISFKHPIY